MPPRRRDDRDDRRPPPRRNNEVWIILAVGGLIAFVLFLVIGGVVAGVVVMALAPAPGQPDEPPPEVAAAPPPRVPVRPWAVPAPVEPPPADLAPVGPPAFAPAPVFPAPPAPAPPAPFVPPDPVEVPPFVRPAPGRPAPAVPAPRDWSRELAEVNPLPATRASAKLFGPLQPDGIVRWTKLDLGPPPPAKQPGFDVMGFPGVCWTPKGDFGYVLTARGKLWRFRHPGGAAELAADWDQDGGSLGWSAAGLVAFLPQLHEVWVVNPDTLAVTRRVGVSGAYRLLTGPGLTDAYALCRADRGEAVVRVGLRDGKLTELALEKDDRPNVMWQLFRGYAGAALSPDGRYLFGEVGISALARFRVEPDRLVLEGATGSIISGAKTGACVSPDGKLVAYPTGGGNSSAGPYSTFVYKAGDLTRPHLTVASGAYPSVIAFDPVGKRIYTQNSEYPLRVYDENGTHRGDAKFNGERGYHNGVGYFPHPGGKALLVRTNDWVAYVEFDR